MWPLERNFAGAGRSQVTIPWKEVNKRYRNTLQKGVHTNTVRISELEHMVLSYEENRERCIFTKLAENMMGQEHAL